MCVEHNSTDNMTQNVTPNSLISYLANQSDHNISAVLLLHHAMRVMTSYYVLGWMKRMLFLYQAGHRFSRIYFFPSIKKLQFPSQFCNFCYLIFFFFFHPFWEDIFHFKFVHTRGYFYSTNLSFTKIFDSL